MTKKKKNSWKVFRSAKTGKFVSKKFASRHKNTTVSETIKR